MGSAKLFCSGEGCGVYIENSESIIGVVLISASKAAIADKPQGLKNIPAWNWHLQHYRGLYPSLGRGCLHSNQRGISASVPRPGSREPGKFDDQIST